MRLVRSYLYAPASNDRILAKVMDRGADAVVLDLEDGVAPDAKVDARRAVKAFLAAEEVLADPGGRPRLLVRVNRDATGYVDPDVRVAVSRVTGAVSLPKAEDHAEVRRVDKLLAEMEEMRGIPNGTIRIHLLIESAVGVEAIAALVRCPRVERLGLGAADLLADLGSNASADHAALDYVRGRLVIASRAAGLAPPVDSVHTEIDDLAGLEASAERGRAFGFFGKSVIHPSHVGIVNRVLAPNDEEVTWATRVIAAAEAAVATGQGAVQLDGEMIDLPVVARAQSVLDLVNSLGSTK